MTTKVQAGDHRRIGQMLVDEELITSGQLREGLERQQERGGKVVENLIALGYLDAKSFLEFLSRQPGIASIDVLHYAIPKEVIDLVPSEFALKQEVLPIDRMGKLLTVAMICPLDKRAIEELKAMTGLNIRSLLVPMKDARSALARYYGPKEVATFEMADAPAPRSTKDQAKGENKAEAEAPVNDPVQQAESGLTFGSLSTLVRGINSLPALPETVHKVREAMELDDISARAIAEIISRDPSLAAKVISLANSAAYNLRHKVDNVERATTMLGLREVYSVVLSAAVIDYFDESKPFNYRGFWRRCMFCATAARVIAKARNDHDHGRISAAGLLHDLGRAVFAEVASKRYAFLDQALSDRQLMEAEGELFGMAHPEAGYILAESWKLPVDITEPIRFHHTVDQAVEVPELVCTVALASLFADTHFGASCVGSEEFEAERSMLIKRLGLAEGQFEALLEETQEALAGADEE